MANFEHAGSSDPFIANPGNQEGVQQRLELEKVQNASGIALACGVHGPL
jgi:hypothetical protein